MNLYCFKERGRSLAPLCSSVTRAQEEKHPAQPTSAIFSLKIKLTPTCPGQTEISSKKAWWFEPQSLECVPVRAAHGAAAERAKCNCNIW